MDNDFFTKLLLKLQTNLKIIIVHDSFIIKKTIETII